jgi:hypothetical protein
MPPPLDLGLERDRAAQNLGGSHRVSLLQRVEADRDRQDQDDDRAADRVAGQNGDDARNEQDQRQRLQQPAQHGAQRTDRPGRRVAVGAIAREASCRLVIAETIRSRRDALPRRSRGATMS